MEDFDLNMDLNLEDLPDMPSFNMNSDFNMDDFGDLDDGGLDDLSDISVDGNPFSAL